MSFYWVENNSLPVEGEEVQKTNILGGVKGILLSIIMLYKNLEIIDLYRKTPK